MNGPTLTIGIIAPPWVAVPPPLYGGTELVIDLLARGLVTAGHRVELFTTGDSTCPVPRQWCFPKALGTVLDPALELEHARAAYAALTDVDLIHDHTLVGPLWAGSLGAEVPVVTTHHGPFTPEMIRHFERVAEEADVIAISHHQASTAPTVPVSAVIHHGIDVGAYPLGAGAGGYLLFLGRMSADKGAHRAIHVARASGKRLLLAAKMWEASERTYFAEVVEPLLGDDAVYLGAVGGTQKRELLADAEAVLNPIRWPEPFGLVMVEALACGTPVLTFPEGAAPEIVDHGVTGFLCNDEADMTRRVAQLGEIDRAACRASAALRFSIERAVRDHVTLYRKVLATHHRGMGTAASAG